MAEKKDNKETSVIVDSDIDFDIIEADEDIALIEAKENRRKLESAIMEQKNIWGYSSLGIEAKAAVNAMASTKIGLYCRVPLICKAKNCPYKDSCTLIKYDLAPEGEYCPIETNQIEMRLAGYHKDFELDDASFTDQNLVNDLISCDILMERCKALMIKEQNPIIDVVTGISEDGEKYTHPEISKAFEMYQKCKKQRDETYQLMMATRKDKAKTEKEVDNVSIFDAIKNKLVEIDENGGMVEPIAPEKTTYVYKNHDTNQ